ncbi:MAG: hypothetical protein JW993_10215 [Sedimentisphaerales bacterium]|nr:hypothetical protein [Sedimentisphaerales bacterium]
MTEPVVQCIVGMTGCGKTTKAECLMLDHSRVLYRDAIGHDYADGLVFSDRPALETYWRRVYRGPFRMVHRPLDPLEDFGRECHLVRECGSLGYVVDEAHLYCKAGKIIDREFTRLIGTGRHYDIDLVCVSQAPKHLAEFLRSQAHEWFVFMLKEPGHVEYVVQRCGGLVTREHVLALERFEYLHYTDYGPDGTPAVWLCRDDIVSGTTDRVQLASGLGQHDASE